MDSGKNILKLRLSLVSSILHECGPKGLLSYISVETYKKIAKDEYVTFEMLKDFSLLSDKNEWEDSMNQLVDMKLVVKNGDHFITRSKMKEWKKWAASNCGISLKFNGHVIIDLSEIYKLKNKRDMNDFIYLSLINCVLYNKSISRQFIYELTGVKKDEQKKIEERQEKHIEVKQHVVPVSKIEQYKLTDHPIMDGTLNTKKLKCKTTKQTFSNCKVTQVGNKYNINLKLFKFLKPKTYNRVRTALNDVLNSNTGVHHWCAVDLIIDTSSDAVSNLSEKVVTVKDKIDWNKYNINKVYTFSNNGNLSPIRSSINN